VILPLASILQPLEDLANWIITFCHDNIGLSWGIAIIAMTFIVRLALLPLSLRGIRSMRRMQVVAPKLQALKEKYKDDPQRFQRETMEVYKREIPFFIAIYQLLRGDTFQQDVQQSPPEGFLFVKSVIEAPHGAELIVLIILFVTTTAASVLLTTAMSPTANPTQKYIMMVFPLVVVPFIINAPAGLAVYWIATNIFSLAQQWVVQRLMPAPAAPTPEEAKASKPPPPPPRKKKRRRR
jgi:YidC/Oxa1 family membrane protein insertase